jgi:hypothetical protein
MSTPRYSPLQDRAHTPEPVPDPLPSSPICSRTNLPKITIFVLLLSLFVAFCVDSVTSRYVLDALLKLNKYVSESGNMGLIYMVLILIVATLTFVPITIVRASEASAKKSPK